ncbi:MAG: PD40 domain-containing protein [Chloracidobacterium sp.]|nr:PD40 domain-containing protein [Chloracidobacterium sp.]
MSRTILHAAILIVFLTFWVLACSALRSETILEPPGRDSSASIGEREAILVNGRRVTPAGRVLRTQSYSWGLALSPDGGRAALVSKDRVQLVGLNETSGPILESFDRDTPGFGSGAYMGVAFSPDGKRLYFGSANDGMIKVLDLEKRQIVSSINVNDERNSDSFIGDFALSRDGRMLYALDQFNFRMVEVDLSAGNVTRSVRVGRHPFGIGLSADGRSAWVTNVGMFEYPLIPGVTQQNLPTAGLKFPAYGFPSREMEEGVMAEGIHVPGLGSPNHPDAMSLFKVDLASGKVEQRIKTGYLVGSKRDGVVTVGGSSPGSVAVGERGVYVANATNDTITIVNPTTGVVEGEIKLEAPGLEHLRGVLPFTVALAPDESRLYVACAGLNAVAVIDLARRRVAGYAPAGWFTSLVALSNDGRTVYAASAKGFGSGPNGGANFVDPGRGRHPGDIMQGTLQILPSPDEKTLAAATDTVIRNTYIKHLISSKSLTTLPFANSPADGPIRHIIFVVKENRTFDQVFGQRSNVRGDPTNATLGLKISVASDDGVRRIDEPVDVSPNHHALADAFAMSDNFYCDSDQSNTGHRWVVGVYPNEWTEVNARSRIQAMPFSAAPGRRNVAGSAGTVLPEDYNEAGALWEHLSRHGVSFFNFGFGTEMPENIERQIHKETGNRFAVSYPLPKPLFDRTSRNFPTFNMAIPDQYRIDMFEQELHDRWLSGREPFPQLITMVLPQDHLTDPHPADGYPFRESYMADNDLALGRLVQTISGTPWWKDTLIIVTEDDPQGGRDHVDAHRSALMFISPHVKKGYVTHTLANFGSVMRLIFVLLRMPPLNQFDGAATLLTDMFAEKPDLTPYRARAVDRRLFDPDVAFKPFDRRFNWKAVAESPVMDDPDDMRAGYFARENSDEEERMRGIRRPQNHR